MKILLPLLALLCFSSLNAQKTSIKSNGGLKDIVYVINLDDEKIEVPNTDGVLNDLAPEWIDNITVVKGNNIPRHIRSSYKDIKGLINIGLKNDQGAKDFFETLKDNLEVLIIKDENSGIYRIENIDIHQDASVNLRSRILESEVLVRLNDEGTYYELDFKTFQDVNPNDIDHLMVIKNKEDLIKNNAADKKGIIEIKLKENERTKKLLKELKETLKEKN